MSQFNHMQTYGGNASPTMKQLLQEGDASKWSPTYSSPPLGRDHDLEEDIDHHQKKSVFTKVKEKAKKLRYTLSNKKKHGEDENTTPSWGFNLDEDEDEDDIDAEYLGAPMYESELAPEDCKENARQHPRADPVIAENHVLANTVNLPSRRDEMCFNSLEALSQTVVGPSFSNNKTTTKTAVANNAIHIKDIQENEATKPRSPSKTLTETITEKLTPVYSTVTDATHAIASKIQSLTVSAPSNPSVRSPPETPKKASSPTIQKTCFAPTAPQAPKLGKGTEQIWDKGVSVKEYLMHKFEPGEDERALSQVLSDALSPRTNPKDVSVVEKMREAVNTMLRADEAPQPETAHLPAKSSSRAEATPHLVAAHSAAKPSSRAEKSPQPMAAHSAAKSSSRAEKAPQPTVAHLATKSSSRTEKAPQPLIAHLAAKSSSRAEEAPQAILAVHLAAKPSSQAEAAPQAILAAHLAAKPSSRVDGAPQPHLVAKSSSNTPIFTTAHRVAEEENLERILQAN